ncbi:MAG: peptidylprolyl isomerase [Roseburia sp.]|nr:peptidylprolyl isomerase [Roseburia sp.]
MRICRRKMLIGFITGAVSLSLCGCTLRSGGDGTGPRVVLTTGFEEGEVFRIEKSSCMLAEIMVYMTNMKNQYEEAYGKEIWASAYNGETLEENIKNTVLARIARIKAMNLLAQEQGVSLSQEELRKTAEAAKIYFDSLNETERTLMGVDEALITRMYEEYALAAKVYEYLIADINPEISDDEARTITVQHILIKTYSLNENNEAVPYSEMDRRGAYQRALEAYRRACNGEEFTSLIAEYSEDETGTYSFGKGSVETVLEEAAFNLGTGEISGIVETEQGYHIIKCISTFDREETDRNKMKIVEQRRKEVFNEEYSSFVEGLTRNIDQQLWESVSFIEDSAVTTSSFFEVYQTIFR